MKNTRILFLTFYHLESTDGISKKICSQVEALKNYNNETILGYIKDSVNKIDYYIGHELICSFNNNIIGKYNLYNKIYEFIFKYIISNDINVVYFRHNLAANRNLIKFFKELKKRGINILLEIPTYPYDGEFKGTSILSVIKNRVDRIYRSNFYKYVDRIITFSSKKEIWNIPTLNISNGVDPDEYNLWEIHPVNQSEFHMIGVANLAYWHGFDRIISGINVYNKNNHSGLKVYFHIVGPINNETYINLKNDTSHYGLEDNVIFHGALSGDELDKVFNMCDIAIGSLGRHRNGIVEMKSLKNVEYAMRGIPFIYSEQNNDFDNKDYILKVSANDCPIDLEKIIDFRINNSFNPNIIRKSAFHLSWKKQMKTIYDYIKSI